MKRHGQNHPYLAAKNAERDFGVNEMIQKAIKSHMWPININDFPKTKEARIITLADKAVATREALTSKKHKEKNRQRYLDHIKTLF